MTEQNGPSLIGAMWRYRVMCVAIVVATTALSGLVAMVTGGDYEATATIGLSTPGDDNVLVPGQQGDASLARYTAQRARFIAGDEVLGIVAAQLGKSDAGAVRPRVTVSASGTANFLTVTASGDSSTEAIELALAVVDAYAAQTARQVDDLTRAAVESLQVQLDELAAAGDDPSSEAAAADVKLEIAQRQATQAVFGDGVEFVVEPTTDTVAAPGLPVRELALGLVLGLALAATAAWARADRNRRVTDPDDAIAVLDRPLLAQVAGAPAIHGAIPQIDAGSLPADDHRMLWAALEQTASSGVIVLQSVGRVRSDLVAAQLAASAARDDLNVLLVDAALERGGLSTALGWSGSVGGLAETLRENTDWQVNVVDLDAGAEYELALLPAGRLGRVDVSAQRFADECARWREAFDYVFIDAEPMGDAHIAVKAARAADGVVLVVGKGANERDLAEFRRLAVFHGIQILGFVFATPEHGSRRSSAASAAGRRQRVASGDGSGRS